MTGPNPIHSSYRDFSAVVNARLAVAEEDFYCAKSLDEHSGHCRCWFGGDACCRCGAPEMMIEQQREAGMPTELPIRRLV